MTVVKIKTQKHHKVCHIKLKIIKTIATQLENKMNHLEKN